MSMQNMNILEAGEPDGQPLILLLHGFPELAYSWRKAMTPLADAGYYVVAPDQRGYGRTTGWDDRFNGDLQSFTISRIAIDAFALVRALGMKAVHTVVGHDFGSPIAAWCGLTRPDVFRSCVTNAVWDGACAIARCTDRPEMIYPPSLRFVGHVQPTLSEQIFDVAIAKRETHIEPNGVPDDRRRKLMAGNEIVMRHLTHRMEARHRCRDNARA